MVTCKDIMKKTDDMQFSQYTIINSSDEEISFICDGREDNLIVLLPNEMITDVCSFTPILLDGKRRIIIDECNTAWKTTVNDIYPINKKHVLTSTPLARHADPEVIVDVTELVWIS